jgi:hypothetical protein
VTRAPEHCHRQRPGGAPEPCRRNPHAVGVSARDRFPAPMREMIRWMYESSCDFRARGSSLLIAGNPDARISSTDVGVSTDVEPAGFAAPLRRSDIRTVGCWSPRSENASGLLRRMSMRPAPEWRLSAPVAVVLPVRRNCPPDASASTRRSMWFQSSGTLCHSSRRTGFDMASIWSRATRISCPGCRTDRALADAAHLLRTPARPCGRVRPARPPGSPPRARRTRRRRQRRRRVDPRRGRRAGR